MRFTQVLTSARKISRAYREWQAADGPTVDYAGQKIKQISPELHEAITAECDATADAGGEEVEPKARALMLAIDEVANAYREWLQLASVQHPSASPRGTSALHRALDRLCRCLDSERPLPPPPPIKILREQGVSPNQIALIYGWKQEDGAPDTTKVFEEIEKPGTHYNPKKWVHPAQVAKEREVEQQWASRTPRAKMFGVAQSKPVNKKAPTLDELLEQRAPAAQIARLTGMDQSDVLAMAEERGIELEKREIKPANQAVALQEAAAK